MASIWDVGNAPEAMHLLIAIFFALGFAPTRFLLNSLVYKRLAIRMLYGPDVPLMADVTRKSKFIKCTESMWKLTYYASVQVWVISILKQTSWAMNTKEYFNGWPNQDLGVGFIFTVLVLFWRGKPEEKISLLCSPIT